MSAASAMSKMIRARKSKIDGLADEKENEEIGKEDLQDLEIQKRDEAIDGDRVNDEEAEGELHDESPQEETSEEETQESPEKLEKRRTRVMKMMSK